MDEKATAAARGRGITGVTMRHADERVVWWCTIEKFGRGSGRFNLGFGATEVRFVTINQVRERGRVERTEQMLRVQGEVCRARIQLSVTKKEKKGKKKQTMKAECALVDKQHKDCRLGMKVVGVLSASCEV